MEVENDFEQITSDEMNQTNDTPSSCFDGNTIGISLPIGGISENFIKNLYEEYHGSSPRFPGGNCVFDSILTFMSYEKIDNTVNYVLTKLKEFDNEQLNDIIVQIFKNTPRTKNRDIISYMRAYVYIYLVEKLGKYFKIGGTNSQLINLVNGGYTFIDQYTMQAFCEMTGTNILVFKENGFNALHNPILCSVKDGKYSDERINIENESNRNSIENYASSLQICRDETDPTVKPSKFNNKDTISIFCFGNHCTPFVTGHSSMLASFFNFCGATILANLFSLFNFFQPRIGAKEINTQKISNFVSRDFIMKKQFDVSKKDIIQKNDKLNWKTIVAITAGIIFALGVATVSALTFGLPLISLFIAKIVIPIAATLAIATFTYVAAKLIKNKKEQQFNFTETNEFHPITQEEIEADKRENSCWYWFRRNHSKNKESPKSSTDSQKSLIPE